MSRPTQHVVKAASLVIIATFLSGCWMSGPRVAELSVSQAVTHGPAGVSEGGFAGHLREAIDSNSARREIYARLTNGQSLWLSNTLIVLETLTLPFAWSIDAEAAALNRDGVPIIRDDFVSLAHAKPVTTALRYTQQASEDDWKTLDGWLQAYQRGLEGCIDREDFIQAGQLSHDLLGQLDLLEAASQSNFAMTRHIVESIGFAAVHYAAYDEAQRAKAMRLAKRFLALQLFGLKGCVGLDREAQKLHGQGIGILVNDLPPIPFHDAWYALRHEPLWAGTGDGGQQAGRKSAQPTTCLP